MTQKILIFIFGAAVGSVASYFFTKKKLKKEYEDKCDSELASMKAYYDEKLEKKEAFDKCKIAYGKQSEEPNTTAASEAPKEVVDKPAEQSLIRRKSAAKTTPSIDYTKFYKETSEMDHPRDDDNYHEVEVNDPEYEENYYGGLEQTEDMENSRGAKFIEAVDFGIEPGMNTMTLLYYQENDILTIEEGGSEEVLKDFDEIESMIGDALTERGFKDNDEPEIYIRNQGRNCDYEIVKVFGAYEE